MVLCQKLQGRSKFGRLFQVSAEGAALHPGNDADTDVSQAIGLSLSQAATQLEELEKKNSTTIQADTDRYDFSKWLDKTG
jgi:hypothetical protein